MKKLFLLVLSFMLILSMSVVFINVGSGEFTDIPAGSIIQSPVGADVTLEDEGADLTVENEGADVSDKSTGAEIGVAAVGFDNDDINYVNNVATWVLAAQYTEIDETILVKSGYTLNINSSYNARAFITKSSSWQGPHFKVEQGGTLNITGKNGAVIAIESESQANNSPQVVVLNEGSETTGAVIDFDYVQISSNSTSYTGTLGGGIYLDGACEKVEITNCSMWWFGKRKQTATSTTNSLNNYSAITADTSAINFTSNFKYTGAAGTAPLIQKCTFDECYSAYGGTIRYQALANNVSGLKILDNTFQEPQSTLATNGGFISIEGGTSGSIDIAGNTFTSGKASNAGGAIYLGAGAQGVVNLNSTVVNLDSTVSEINSYITSSSANFGGGIAVSANITDEVVINLGSDESNFTIASSSAGATSNGLGLGGAVYIGSDKATVNVNGKAHIGVNISDQDRGNSANKGGAFYVANGTLNVKGGKVSFNDSTNNSSYNGDHEGNGGAICAGGGTVNITGGNLKANAAASHGGAIAGYGTSVINISGGVVGTETTTNTDWNTYINKAENGYGGAVYINGSTLNISGSALLQTSKAHNGGSVYCVGANFTMSGGKIANAQAQRATTSVGYGAGIYISNCTSVMITGGEISNCTGTFGGGISVHGTAVDSQGNPTTQILGGIITNNTGLYYGGGIYIHDGSNVVVGGEVIIDNNDTDSKDLHPTDAKLRRGGGIYVGDGGSLKLCGNATISNNDAFMGGGIYFCNAVSAVIDGTETESPVISGNHAGDSGGGIVIDGCTLTVNYAEISDNVAEVEAIVYNTGNSGSNVITDEMNFGGGGILLWLEDSASTLDFKNGVMSGNMAWEGSGGAICSSRKYNTDTNEGYINIYGGTFTSNQAGNGGAIYSDYLTELTMNGGTVGGLAKDANDYKTVTTKNTDNPAIKVPKVANCAYGTTDGDYGGGGGLYIRGKATLKDVNILGNLAARGGGMDLGTSSYTTDGKIYSGQVTSERCLIKGNISTDFGGGVYLTTADLTSTTAPKGIATYPTYTSKNDEICANVAVSGGGIFAGARTTVDLIGAYIDDNRLRYFLPAAASGAATPNGGQYVYGAGIYSQGATLNTVGSEQNYCSISRNRALDPELDKGNVNIIDTSYPKANVRGGALFAFPTAINKISYTAIDNNEAYDLGGGLYIASTKGATFTNSGVNPNAKTTLDHVIVSYNSLTSTFYDAPGTTKGDIPSNGAGVYVTVGGDFQKDAHYTNPTVNNANFAMTNSQIHNNKCTGFGGGFFIDYYYQDDNTELFSNNRIYENTAGYGGGINFAVGAGSGVSGYKKVNMGTTDVYGNIATVEGGGIRSNGYIVYTGDVYDNDAPIGGGLYVASGTFTTTSEITNNTAIVGGGVYASDGTCTVNLVDGKAPVYGNFADPKAGNSLASQGDDVYAKSGATLIIPAVKVYYDDVKFGLWYSDFNKDRFRTGPDLINNALLVSSGRVTPTTSTTKTYTSNGEVAATLHLPSANVSLGELKALDPWGGEYDPQIEVSDGVYDSKYQYEFVICKDDMILSNEDFTGDYEFIAYSITANGETKYGHFKDSETGSVFVSPGETFSIGGLVAGLQLKMYTPADGKIMTSFVKSIDAKYDWGNKVVDIATEKVKSGLSVVKNITTDAIPALETIASYTASVTNHIFGTKVTINYYDREVSKGKATDISSTPTQVTKTYLGPDYVDYFNNSDTSGIYQLNNFSHMITGAGVSANNKARGINNIIDQYYLWHSQAGAVDGVKNTIYPGTDVTYAEYDGYETTPDFANHTDETGQFVTGANSKWVTYTTASGTEVTPGVYNKMWDNFSELKDANGNEAEIHSVNEINVWLFNTPKIYNIKVYSAQRESHLGEKYDNIIVADNEPRKFSAYYNQRFNGQMDDDSDIASSHLLKYNDEITGYIDEYISTAYRIRTETGNYFFQYWSYDPEGKVVASTDISYSHRVTGDVELYAIYGQGEFWDTGLTLLENNTDFYHKDTDNDNVADTEFVRFNTINTPYNTTNVDRVASLFLDYDKKSVVEEIDVNELRTALQDYLATNPAKGLYDYAKLADDTSEQAQKLVSLITLTDLKGNTLNANIAIDVYDIKDLITEDHDIEKTTLDRVQFNKEYQLSDVEDKTVISLGGMRDGGTWYISTNTVEYFLSSVELDVDGEGELGTGDGDIDDWF